MISQASMAPPMRWVARSAFAQAGGQSVVRHIRTLAVRGGALQNLKGFLGDSRSLAC